MKQHDDGYTNRDGTHTGGWSGSAASRDRAVADERSGRRSGRMAEVLRYVNAAMGHGVTWAEVADRLNIHHGAASGALSNLHKSGQVARLVERRRGSSVYVALDRVEGRPVSPFGRTGGLSAADAAALRDEIDQQATENARLVSELASARRENDRLTAQVIDNEEAYDNGYTAGRAEGHAEGWQEAKAEADPKAAAEDRNVALVKGKILVSLRDRIQQAEPVMGVRHHNSMCHTQHVPCALNAVKAVVENA